MKWHEIIAVTLIHLILIAVCFCFVVAALTLWFG